MRWSPPTAFIAICWASDDASAALDIQAIEQRLAKADLRPVFRTPGVLIGVRNANAPHLIMRKFGEDVVVLGSLLRQGSLAPLDDFTEPNASDAHAWARRLAVQAWGRYIAFFRSGGRWWLMRDPSGAVECLRVERGALRFYGSWTEDLRPFLPLAAPDWAAIHEFLLDGRLPGDASALQGMSTVAPGSAECVTADEAIQAWRPESLIRNEESATVIPEALRLRLLTLADASARISGASYWRVLGRGITEGLLRMPARRVSSKEDAHEIIAPRQDPRRVDDDACSGIPPGKQRQIAALGEAREYLSLSVLNAALDGFPPMLAQPFVEACLATPTYRFGASGYDRSPLRDGFAPMLPEEVRRRRSKAGMTRYYCDGILRNLSYARELLLDGVLVREGLVDRARLAKALRPDVIISRPSIDAILAMVVAETWLARWQP